ncbi:putative multiple-sugar transport system permease YteP [Spirochaetia bacterium]|nr:putative multiple-sugar transport system permease YteP [Spirochaetia bacterium]
MARPSVAKKPFSRSAFYKDRWLYLMLLPGIVFFVIYKYGPMWGITLAFKNYRPFLGFFGSAWVGLENFERFFTDRAFMQLFSNTLILSLLNLVINFPVPIIFALLFNEVRNKYFLKIVQTVTYLPHFMSWVVVAGLSYVMFTTEGGIINEGIKALGFPPINFLSSEKLFRPMIVGQAMWRETGWGTIVYLAALSGVDVEQYEAARIDGANRLQQLWHITLPSIKVVIITMFILRLGNILDTGFDQIYNMLNEMNRSVGEVFDTYVYRFGINMGQLSYSTAVGVFKSVIGLILVLGTDRLAKKAGEEGIL